MEDECLCSPLNFEFYSQQEALEDLRSSVLQTTMELQSTIITAKEEITRRECELIHLNDLLNKVIKERDESQAQCHKLMLEKQQLQQNHQILQIHEDDDGGVSKKQYCSDSGASDSSDCDEKNKTASSSSSPTLKVGFDKLLSETEKKMMMMTKKKELPEKGKLLKAVMEAGPLLQTLLMAGGPLPQWQHPPPLLDSIETPPILALHRVN